MPYLNLHDSNIRVSNKISSAIVFASGMGDLLAFKQSTIALISSWTSTLVHLFCCATNKVVLTVLSSVATGFSEISQATDHTCKISHWSPLATNPNPALPLLSWISELVLNLIQSESGFCHLLGIALMHLLLLCSSSVNCVFLYSSHSSQALLVMSLSVHLSAPKTFCIPCLPHAPHFVGCYLLFMLKFLQFFCFLLFQPPRFKKNSGMQQAIPTYWRNFLNELRFRTLEKHIFNCFKTIPTLLALPISFDPFLFKQLPTERHLWQARHRKCWIFFWYPVSRFCPTVFFLPPM